MTNRERGTHFLTRAWRSYLSLGVMGAIVVWIHVSQLPSDVYWWTPDSAAYIEAARSLLSEGQLLIFPGLYSDENLEPLRLWPPGFPILIGSITLVADVPAEAASVLIAMLSWVLLGPIVFFTVSPIIRRRHAVIVAVYGPPARRDPTIPHGR